MERSILPIRSNAAGWRSPPSSHWLPDWSLPDTHLLVPRPESLCSHSLFSTLITFYLLASGPVSLSWMHHIGFLIYLCIPNIWCTVWHTVKIQNYSSKGLSSQTTFEYCDGLSVRNTVIRRHPLKELRVWGNQQAGPARIFCYILLRVATGP